MFSQYIYSFRLGKFIPDYHRDMKQALKAAVKPATEKKTPSRRPAPEDAVVLGGLALVLKAKRREADLTLDQVARRCGLATSTISKIENGKLSPGYETIVQLARGLGVEVADLFSTPGEAPPTGRRSVTRKGQGLRHRSRHYEYEVQAHDVSRKDFLPLVTTIRARSLKEFDTLPSHQGQEFIYVVSGRLVLHTEHYEPLQLDPGDSVYFDSSMGHACMSAGDQDATVVWVCSRITATEVAAAA